MKRILIFCAVATILVIGACKKEKTYSKTVKVTYPGITLKGDSAVSIAVGATYSDAGATLTDDITGAQSDITATNSNVDASTPGLYFVTYQAKNSNGFITSKQRPVVVTSVAASWDLTGTYVRASNSVPVNVKKVATGLYLIDNVGGVDPATSAGFLFSAYMGQIDDSTLVITEQQIADGSLLSTDFTGFTAAPGDTSYSYVVNNGSFGPSERVFVKQ